MIFLAVSAYVFDGIFSCSDLVKNKEQEKTWQLKKSCAVSHCTWRTHS